MKCQSVNQVMVFIFHNTNKTHLLMLVSNFLLPVCVGATDTVQ